MDKPLTGRTIGVTGATGMVGRYLMRELAARGAIPIAIVRSPNKPPSLSAQGFEVRQADLKDQAALEAALTGLDGLIANAATIALGGQSPAAVLNNNLEGTRHVFAAAAACGIKRAVLTSSAVVYRPGKKGHYVESDAIRSLKDYTHRFNCYAISKAAAEEAAQELCAKAGIALSIARPHQVHGAFDQHSFTVWLRRLMSPRWVSVWLTHWYFPSVYAGDLAQAMCRMLESDVAAGQAFNICGEPGVNSYWDHFRAWRESGQRVPKLVIPIPLPLRREFSIDKARTLLGWSPRPLTEGFVDLVQFERAVNEESTAMATDHGHDDGNDFRRR